MELFGDMLDSPAVRAKIMAERVAELNPDLVPELEPVEEPEPEPAVEEPDPEPGGPEAKPEWDGVDYAELDRDQLTELCRLRGIKFQGRPGVKRLVAMLEEQDAQ